MDAKKFTELLRKFTFSRFRIFNIKLWGNNRWGLYREFSIDDVATLIHEFNSLFMIASVARHGIDSRQNSIMQNA